MFFRVVKISFVLVLISVILMIVFINARINHTPEKGDIDKDLQLLKKEIDDGADLEMQNVYPEGYVFMNALYALSNRDNAAEMNRSFDKINSIEARSRFNADLPLQYGAFYTGWSSFVLGSKLDIDNPEEVKQFIGQCDSIANALENETLPESYAGGAWPADVSVCVASLALHDKMFSPRYDRIIEPWISEVKKNLDSHRMIPHALNQEARGSSMALMLVFLKDIDKDFAEEQFQLFKENFVDTRFGLTGIRGIS